MSDKSRGRVENTLAEALKPIVFGSCFGEEHLDEIRRQTQMDKAHILMLEICGLMSKDCAAWLITAIEGLEKTDFKPLYGRELSRGLYFLYEDFLIETIGAQRGGQLHLARSRNDLKATGFLLGLRGLYMKLLEKEVLLCEKLASKAIVFKECPMAIYTHYQPALPISYGHYLCGVAENTMRHIEDLRSSYGLLSKSPLGAGAAGGTTFPIEPEITASLLGFEGTFENSVDAVASRDILFKLTAHTAILGNQISRISQDYLLWCSNEHGSIGLSDEYVGISSMMPNKRNPFLFEQLQGKAGLLSGAFTAALSASAGAPYTNSIAVGTEGISVLKPALETAYQCLDILTALIGGAEPRSENMKVPISAGYALATEYANELVRQYGLSFRSAHEAVGGFVKEHYGKECFEELEQVTFAVGSEAYVLPSIKVEDYLKKAAYGFGPSCEKVEAEARRILSDCKVTRGWCDEIKELWDRSHKRMEDAILQRGLRNGQEKN